MIKKTFSIFFIFLIVILSVFSPITASAYEVTSFEITAKAGMLVCLGSDDMPDEILYQNNIDTKVYPASIAKIMTAVLMLESEKWDPEAKVTLSKEVLDMVLGTGLAVSLFTEGEEFTQLDMLYMVLVSSWGDITYQAAITYGGTVENFVDMMNNKAKELGLNSTHYSNPVGLHEEETYTTVRDIYKLAKYAMKHETFNTITSKSRHKVHTTKGTTRTLSTTNFLLDSSTNYYYKPAKGMKTGYTDKAGRCLVSVASNKRYNYMCILMNCPNNPNKRHEFSESKQLYEWAFKNFSFKEVAKSDEPVCEIPVEYSLDTDFVPLYFKKPFGTILPNEADQSTIVVKTIFKSETAKAPIKKGDVLGKAEITYAEKVIGTVDLVAGNDVASSNLLIAATQVKNFFTSIYMKLLYAAIGIVVVVFIILCIKLNLEKLKKRRVRYIPYNKDEK